MRKTFREHLNFAKYGPSASKSQAQSTNPELLLVRNSS